MSLPKDITNVIKANPELYKLKHLLYATPGRFASDGHKITEKVTNKEATAFNYLIRSSATTLLFLFFQYSVKDIALTCLPQYLFKNDLQSLESIHYEWVKDEKNVTTFIWILRKERRNIINGWVYTLLSRPQALVLFS